MNAILARAVIKKPLSGAAIATDDKVAVESAVALEYNGIHFASMMATPQDLEDFARGFSLSEGIISSREDIYGIDVEAGTEGIVLRITIGNRHFAALKTRQAALTGRSGCGICGRDALTLVATKPPKLQGCTAPEQSAIATAVEQLQNGQQIRSVTGATHAAALCDEQGKLICLREDVGRHNALDKLIGATMQNAISVDNGFLLLSSRASFEMVHKAAVAGFRSVIALSAPTSLAIDKAQQANINLLGFARSRQSILYNEAQS